jgi:hypothetical protein
MTGGERNHMFIKVFANVPSGELEGRVQVWIDCTPRFQIIKAIQTENAAGNITLTLFCYPLPVK